VYSACGWENLGESTQNNVQERPQVQEQEQAQVLWDSEFT